MPDIVIVGGGQAGLALGQGLKEHGADFVILDRSPEPGWVWRQRYSSLKLFTPSQYSSLPGLPIPLAKDTYLTKDQVADYLRNYARHFDLPVENGVTVNSLVRHDTGFRLETSRGRMTANRVVVAAGQTPWRPDFAGALDPDVLQLHSADYKDPLQLPPGDVIVVGAGNSGAQIAEELTESHTVYLSYEELPKQFPQRYLGKDIFFWFMLWGVMSKKRDPKRPGERAGGAVPLIGGQLREMLKDGRIRRLPRTRGCEGGHLAFADGTVRRPDTVIWSTGYRYKLDWLMPEATDSLGLPIHVRGVSPVPNLYYIGLQDQYRKSSGFIGFLRPDVDYLVKQLFPAVGVQPRTG